MIQNIKLLLDFVNVVQFGQIVLLWNHVRREFPSSSLLGLEPLQQVMSGTQHEKSS